MGRFSTPRRIGSTGWMMHAASRQAYYNRGSNAAYADNDPLEFVKVMGVILIGGPLLLLFLMGLLVSPGGAFLLLLVPIAGLVPLIRSRIRRGN